MQIQVGDMSSSFPEHLDAIVLGALIGFLIIETVLSGTWNRMYFTVGLPIFIMRVPVEFRHSNIPSSSHLEEHSRSTLVTSLVFKEVEPNTYGFREKAFEFGWRFHYPSLMHGMLFFDFDHNQVVIKGFANWFMLCFSLIWIGGVFLEYEPLVALVFVFVFSLFIILLYSIQYDRFSKVIKLAAEAWSRKHIKI